MFVRHLLVGLVFGITLTKAELISWFRIYEMFRFQSFHMYGVIGSAVLIGIVYVQIIKRTGMKSSKGDAVDLTPKEKSISRYLLGGIIFGFGWALTGACPGPLFVLLGNGFTVIIVVILSALLGTYAYGLLKDRLPH